MDKKIRYTAEEGLAVLNYLGITNSTDKEKQTFRKDFGTCYQWYKGDFIGSIENFAKLLKVL